MSFSTMIKTEILESKPMRGRSAPPFAHGFFAFCKGFSELVTESEGAAGLFETLLLDYLGEDTDIFTEARQRGDRTVYTVRLNRQADALKLAKIMSAELEGFKGYTSEQAAAFIAGAFLACGNITDPEKSYHVEFSAKENAHILKTLLNEYLPGAKTTTRKTGAAIYYKEHEQIEDLLILMGAQKACLAMIDIEILKSMRNSANRATNCETANLDKLVNAAAARLGDIALVLDSIGEKNLPENLLEAAKLRLENPEASIRELAAIANKSRSGLQHRFARLSQMAEDIRQKAGVIK